MKKEAVLIFLVIISVAHAWNQTLNIHPIDQRDSLYNGTKIPNASAPTSLTMVLKYLYPDNPNISLNNVVEYSINSKLFNPFDPQRIFISPANISLIAENFCSGIESGQIPKHVVSKDAFKFFSALFRIKLMPIIVDARIRFMLNETSHFVVVNGINSDTGQILITDPYVSAQRNNGALNWKDTAGYYWLNTTEFDPIWNSEPDHVNRWWLICLNNLK